MKTNRYRYAALLLLAACAGAFGVPMDDREALWSFRALDLKPITVHCPDLWFHPGGPSYLHGCAPIVVASPPLVLPPPPLNPPFPPVRPGPPPPSFPGPGGGPAAVPEPEPAALLGGALLALGALTRRRRRAT